jgi:hypothetical protein
MNFALSNHAIEQMKSRGISLSSVERILQTPDAIVADDGTTVYQSVVFELNKAFLIRIFVNVDKVPPMVVTAYKTSKVNKYYAR